MSDVINRGKFYISSSFKGKSIKEQSKRVAMDQKKKNTRIKCLEEKVGAESREVT